MVHVREWIEFTAQAVEVLAVVIMVCFIVRGTVGWLIHSAKNAEWAYERYRIVLGKALLIGLELLVAADIINTVVFALTLQNLALLAGLVVVRTTLGWTVTVEVEGRWPWQAAGESRKESERQPAHILDPPADTSIMTAGRAYEPFGRNAER
ncbi:MAG TPA: DUF1622 domain-containing protein [Bryobacteraceae bacterium]|jgi:uncharacterized membrane protein|nr:DUF1622 domain-containing protein [Bryobacteraceae bacterium]